MAATHHTLILTQAQIATLATPRDYLAAVEQAFRELANGEVDSLPVGHVPGTGGAFHLKAAVSARSPRRAVIKVNGNFPGNPQRNALPTIQGFVALVDAEDGRLLALMDSIELTARRTAAASALAARHLARRDARRLAFVGCGTQARHHLEALLALDEFAFREMRCYDPLGDCAESLRARGAAAGLVAIVADSVADACRDADVILTSTPSTQPILEPGMVAPGTCLLAVGADNPSKCELAPALLAQSRVVPDIAAQSIAMGDLRAAIAAGAMSAADIHAELAQLVAGTRPGRTRAEETFVFDSTGTAIEDLAAATMLHARAETATAGLLLPLNDTTPSP
jgi:alanine dehydrogenase